MWMVLAASGVVLRVLTRERASTAPVGRTPFAPGQALEPQNPMAAAHSLDTEPFRSRTYSASPAPREAATPARCRTTRGAPPTVGTGEGAGMPASEEARQLAHLSRPELFGLARSRGVPHTVMMTREDLIEALSRLDN